MKKIILYSFVLGLIYVFGASEAKAQIPQGSYLASCKVASVNAAEGTLTANCNTKNDKNKVNKNFKYKYCLGDISNQDGWLTCAKDQAKINADIKAADEKAAAEKAKKDAEKAKKDAEEASENIAANKEAEKAKIAKLKPTFDAGALMILGREALPLEITNWSKQIEKNFTTAEEIKDGIKLPQVLKYLKGLISDPLSKFMRANTINLAYLEVHGRESTPVEQATWDGQFLTGKATFASMVLGEKDKLNKNAADRKAMIDRVYLKTMGRNATADEIKYWQSSPDHFRQIVEAARTYLYSTNGVQDRVDTAARALKAANKPAADGDVKKVLTNFSNKKAIYSEMVEELKKG